MAINNFKEALEYLDFLVKEFEAIFATDEHDELTEQLLDTYLFGDDEIDDFKELLAGASSHFLDPYGKPISSVSAELKKAGIELLKSPDHPEQYWLKTEWFHIVFSQ